MAQNYAIAVDTGGMERMDPTALLRNMKLARSALDAMKGSVRSFGAGIDRAARGLARMGDAAKGVVSALMHAANVAQGLESGMMNLYRWGKSCWREFASSLDSLATSALYLRNSLAAMAAPLVNALAPAIDYVTDRLVGLFNLVCQLFARLTGSNTYVAAKRTADAWDSVGGRISRATSALKRYIGGFDQLNVLTDGASGSGSGGSGGGGGGAGMFEERQIDAGLSAFADGLRAAFEASDWMALGGLLGEKVNALVESVDWQALGQKVGYYVNALFSTAYWTLEAVNFENIGASAAEFLNNALSQVDFSKVGGSVALLLTSFCETVAGFVEAFDWAQFAEKLAEGVNGFVSTVGEKLDAIDWAGLALRLTDGLNAFIAGTDWALAGRTLAGRANDLLSTLGTAAATFDWSGAGTALAASVNGLFRNVDWDGLGRWMNDTLLGALDFGLAFVNGFDAKGFADGIGRALSQVDWDAVSDKLWQLFSAALKKLGELVGGLLFGGTADATVNLSLLKKGWTTITAWLGIDSPLSALLALVRSGWTSIAAFVGTAVTAAVSLSRSGWTSIGGYVGTAVTAAVSLSRNGWTSIGGFVGTAVTAVVSLAKKNKNDSVQGLFGASTMSVLATLANANKKKYTPAKIFGTTLNVVATVTANSKSKTSLVSTVTGWLKNIKVGVSRKAAGGAITAGGREIGFAAGGVISGGVARYLSAVPHYAAGTTRAHGTVFVAGEAGPEIMGHINGRTEILNKSQIADAIYSAVVAGMGRAVNALGSYLGNRMGECANAIVATIGSIGGAPDLRGLEYHAPVMAAGTVLPYDVAAQVARSGADLQDTLDANNEDLIQTIISVAGQIVAAIGSREQQAANRSGGGLTAQQMINEINRRTQMFGASPITGV